MRHFVEFNKNKKKRFNRKPTLNVKIFITKKYGEKIKIILQIIKFKLHAFDC